jgi:hypothetical protein
MAVQVAALLESRVDGLLARVQAQAEALRVRAEQQWLYRRAPNSFTP